MAGIRTAPAFTAAATKRIITLGLVDSTNDLFAEDWSVPVGATAIAIEAWAAAYAAASNCSLYYINEVNVRQGAKIPSNAVEAVARNGVENGVNLLVPNNTTLESRTGRLVAPVAAVFPEENDKPDPNSGVLSDLITAYIAISTAADYFQSAQYTTRRERKNNPRATQ